MAHTLSICPPLLGEFLIFPCMVGNPIMLSVRLGMLEKNTLCRIPSNTCNYRNFPGSSPLDSYPFGGFLKQDYPPCKIRLHGYLGIPHPDNPISGYASCASLISCPFRSTVTAKVSASRTCAGGNLGRLSHVPISCLVS